MELTQLKHFIAVASNNSIKKAAEELFVTSSALSKSISKLEEELGVSLFERTSNSLRLNKAGKLVLLYAKNVIEELKDMDEQLDIYRDVERNTRTLSFCSDELSAFRVFLTAFIQEHPKITVSHTLKRTSAECVDGLLAGNFDMAFLYDDLALNTLGLPGGIRYMPFYTDRLLLRVPLSHPLAGEKEVHLKALDKTDIIVLSDSEHDRTFCEELNSRYGIAIHWQYYNDVIVYQRMLRNNTLASLSTNIERLQLADSADARYLRIRGVKAAITYYAVYPVSKADKLRPFFDFIGNYRNLSDMMSRGNDV